MTTSTANNTRVTQKDLLGESFYSLISGSWKIKKNLSKASGIIFDYLFEYFCRIHKDKCFFSTEKIMSDTGYSFNTVKNSIKELAENNIFIIREYKSNDFVILVNKISNQKYISKFDSGEIQIINASFFDDKTDKKFSNFIQNSVKKFQNIGKIFQKSDENSQTFDEKNQSIVKHEVTNNIENKEFKSLEKQSLDLNIIDNIYIDHHHIDNKNQVENFINQDNNLTQESNNDDDDFLKNFDKESEEKSNTVIEVLEEKSDKVDSSKSNKYETDKPDLTHNEKNSVGVAGANCGQNVDKLTDKEKELYSLLKAVKNADDKILIISEKDILKIIKEVPETRIREEIERTAVRRDKKQNQAIGTPYFLSLVFKPESTIPETLKQKQIIESKETAKHTLAPIIKIFREWYKDNENLNLAKNSLFLSMKTLYEQNTSRFIDKVHYCKKQFENFNDLAKELFTGEILEVIQAI